MATAIPLSIDQSPQPDCDQASLCSWFEKFGPASSQCANRDSNVCRKRLDDVFAPHGPKNGDKTRK